MDEENKSVEESKYKNLSDVGKQDASEQKGCEKRIHSKLSCLEWVVLVISYIAFVLASLFLIDQLCFGIFQSCICCTYVAFGILIAVLIIDRLIRTKLFIHKARLEDESEVIAMIIEAKTVEPRLLDPEKPDNYEEKKIQLKKEVERLENLGPKEWTEYQVLSLNQLLVDFLKVDELKARARSSLEDLQEYADDRYDEKHYDELDWRIDEAINNIEDAHEPSERDDAAEVLRGELRTLLEHVADYDRYWAEGSEIIRGLMTCGVVAIPILLAMGLLPILHPASDVDILHIFNWGLLGISGAITAVLLNIRSSNLVKVGSTRGKEELWRAVLGSTLGLVAGILLYSMIAGGILSGSIFPDDGAFLEISSQVEKPMSKLFNIARSIFWGIASGFSFEWVFDSLRNVTKGRN